MAHSTIEFKGKEAVVKDAVIEYLLDDLLKFIDKSSFSGNSWIKETLTTYYNDWYEMPPGCNYLELSETLKEDLHVDWIREIIKEYLESKNESDEVKFTCERILTIIDQ